MPRRRSARISYRCPVSISAPSAASAWMCVSIRRRPMTSPPGGGTVAVPKRASSGPARRMDARIWLQSSSSSSVVVSAGGVDAHLVRADPVGLCTGTANEGEHRVHVEDSRNVSELHGLAREQRRGEDRQGGVLVPGRLHAPRERVPSLDHERLSQGVLDDGLHGDGSLPIPMSPTREQAWTTLTTYTKAEPLLRHALAVEASVGWYARHFGEDEERVARRRPPPRLRLRDAPDARQASPGRRADPARGGLSGGRDRGGALPRRASGDAAGHAAEEDAFACDELSGFVTACGCVRPDGIETLEPKSVRKKLKQPSFAAGVHRDEVYRGAEELGLELDEHIANVIEALRPIAGELGLKTTYRPAARRARGPRARGRRPCAARRATRGAASPDARERDVVDSRTGRRIARGHELLQPLGRRREIEVSGQDDRLTPIASSSAKAMVVRSSASAGRPWPVWDRWRLTITMSSPWHERALRARRGAPAATR